MTHLVAAAIGYIVMGAGGILIAAFFAWLALEFAWKMAKRAHAAHEILYALSVIDRKRKIREAIRKGEPS